MATPSSFSLRIDQSSSTRHSPRTPPISGTPLAPETFHPDSTRLLPQRTEDLHKSSLRLGEPWSIRLTPKERVKVTLARSLPRLPGERAASHHDVASIELGVGLGVLDAPVGAPALGALERARRHHPRERMRVARQAFEPIGGALNARIAPQRLARGGAHRRRRLHTRQRLELPRARRPWSHARPCRLLQRAARRAPTEHE